MTQRPSTALLMLTLLLVSPCATAQPAAQPAAPAPPPPAPLPEFFESEEFIVAFAKEGDTAERLAQRFLGDPAKGWMIEEYNRTASFTKGQKVIVPKQPWNLSGVYPNGYQLVPVNWEINTPDCRHGISPLNSWYSKKFWYIIPVPRVMTMNSLRKPSSARDATRNSIRIVPPTELAFMFFIVARRLPNASITQP